MLPNDLFSDEDEPLIVVFIKIRAKTGRSRVLNPVLNCLYGNNLDNILHPY